MRKISKSLIFMGLFAPWGAHALGIGDIILHSALDESLNAEIPLVTSNDEDLSDIRVGLASPEAFAHAHIERSYLLTKLNFTTKKNSDGSLAIRVSSKNAIREPILDFMLEVYWPQGRLLREFTVLLDPPDSLRQASAASAESPDTDDYSHDRPNYQNSSPARGQPGRLVRQDRGMAASKAETSALPVTGTQYGPVSRNETLWNIAQKFQDPKISQRQMLHGLYKANPKAFYKGSMDALKAGVTITIPDQASIMRLTGSASVPQEPRTGGVDSRAKTAESLDTGTNEEPGTQGRLKLLPPPSHTSSAVAATGGKEGKTGKQEQALELADSAKQELEAFRKRLSELEQQMSAMQRLLVLKDEQIAKLLARETPPAKETQQPAQQHLAAIPPASGSANIAPSAETGQANSQPAVHNAALPQASPAASEPPTVRPTVPPAPKQTDSALPKPPPRVPVPTPAIPTATVNEEGFLAALLEQPYFLVGGATGLVLLALLWQFNRRRSAMVEDAESILTITNKEKITHPEKPTPEPVDTSHIVTEQTTTTVFRSSFLSEFTPSDFDALSGDMTEVDPISEADVYLAYGRYKQAEDLILSAIGQNPERDDCRLKLFEIHYATENAQAFEKCAQELAPTHKDAKPEFWEKIIEMGRELCPRNPLFNINQQSTGNYAETETSKAGNAAVRAEENIYLFNQEDELDLPVAPPVAGAGKPKQGPLEDTHPSIAYDFFSNADKESGGETSSRESADTSENPEIENIIPFDKNEIYTDVEEIEIPSENMEEIEIPSENMEEIDIPSESMEEMLAKLNALSEHKPVQHNSGENTQSDQNQKWGNLVIDQVETDDQENAFDFEKDIPDNSPPVELDDLRTKLDLAKAYYDLGDEESAFAILQNVALFGNSYQKEEANSLLAKLNVKG